MTGPNGLHPSGELVEQSYHEEAAAAVLHFAAGTEETIAAESTAEPTVQQPDLPKRFTEKWAIQGSHPTWLGFDSRTGLPKVG